jgi:hypothetical protein
VRTYYIAAEEVMWDYAPSGINQITGPRLSLSLSLLFSPLAHKSHESLFVASHDRWLIPPSSSMAVRTSGEPFDSVAQIYTASGPQRIGTVYKKAIYRYSLPFFYAQPESRKPL